MNLSRIIYDMLPRIVQDRITFLIMKSGKIVKTPLFKELLGSLIYFGGEKEEIDFALNQIKRHRNLPAQVFIDLGDRLEAKARAHELSSRNQEACLSYHKASTYYITAGWFSTDLSEIKNFHKKSIPCYNSFRRLHQPPIEKIKLPFPRGSLYGFFRTPNRGEPPFPVVLFVQGSYGVKEFNYNFENAALMNGLAVFNFDPCGWGESGLTGNKFRGSEDYQKSLATVIDYLEKQDNINSKAIACFGIGYGGGLSHFAHGLEQRIRVSAGIGGSFKETLEPHRLITDIEIRRKLVYTGLINREQYDRWTEKLDYNKFIRQTRGPALIVHGSKDRIVPLSQAKNMHESIPKSDLWIRDDGHLCNNGLKSQLAEDIFHWISFKLQDINKH